MDTATSTPVSTDVSSVDSTSNSSTTYVPPVVFTNASSPKAKGSWGAVFGIVAILALVLLAALYVWGERVATEGDSIQIEASQ